MALTVALQPVSQAYAAGTLDQSQPLGLTFSSPLGGPFVAAQTFTAGLSGNLDQVNLMLQQAAPPGIV
jgi:hypothetical protein